MRSNSTREQSMLRLQVSSLQGVIEKQEARLR